MMQDPRKVIETAISQTSEPIKITWENLEFSVTKKVKKQTVTTNILKGCSGSAMPGQATFIMGASGAGKTSLLNVISDRITRGGANKISGKVLINDT